MGAVKSSLAINDGMTPALRRINKAMSLMINNFEAVQRASGKAVNTADLAAARREIGAANALLDDMERNYRTINDQQEQLNNKISKTAPYSFLKHGAVFTFIFRNQPTSAFCAPSTLRESMIGRTLSPRCPDRYMS